ncbi:MAG: hypothetical protein P3T54_00120 [Dehalogenimonas sp.]|nr:hypothetical protein [Dehalogenimonas sp.]
MTNEQLPRELTIRKILFVIDSHENADGTEKPYDPFGDATKIYEQFVEPMIAAYDKVVTERDEYKEALRCEEVENREIVTVLKGMVNRAEAELAKWDLRQYIPEGNYCWPSRQSVCKFYRENQLTITDYDMRCACPTVGSLVALHDNKKHPSCPVPPTAEVKE